MFDSNKIHILLINRRLGGQNIKNKNKKEKMMKDKEIHTGAGDKQCRSFTMASEHALKQTNMKCINALGIV